MGNKEIRKVWLLKKYKLLGIKTSEDLMYNIMTMCQRTDTFEL